MDAKSGVSLKFVKLLWIGILVVVGIVIFMIAFLKIDTTKKVDQHVSMEIFTGYLDERIPRLMKNYRIPGVIIALVTGGKTVWTNAYGYADLKKGRKMTTDTYCRVESISKSVTAWGVMKLVEQGRIELDLPVEFYIRHWKFPKSRYSLEKVTVGRLLSHSAGMPLGTVGVRYSPREVIPSLEESLAKDAILMQEPGLSFFYSNTGFNLLELLVEEVTGRDFTEYMSNEVLNPLGMHHSSFTWSEAMEPVPVGYDVKGNPIPVYIYPEKASGGLFATVGDMATFVTAGMTEFSHVGLQVLNAQYISKLYTPMVKVPGFYGLAFESYGLGHFIEILPNGKKAVSHGGQGSGWMTHFHSVPETGDGIVILTNSQRSWPFFALILSDWARWNGFFSVGMGRIIQGTKVLWAFIGLIWVILLGQMWRLVKGLVSGCRQFAPLCGKSRQLRIVQSSLFMVLLAGLLWAVNQDYLFLSSVFPVASGWLGFSVFVSALVLLLSALFPCWENSKKERKS